MRSLVVSIQSSTGKEWFKIKTELAQVSLNDFQWFDPDHPATAAFLTEREQPSHDSSTGSHTTPMPRLIYVLRTVTKFCPYSQSITPKWLLTQIPKFPNASAGHLRLATLSQMFGPLLETVLNWYRWQTLASNFRKRLWVPLLACGSLASRHVAAGRLCCGSPWQNERLRSQGVPKNPLQQTLPQSTNAKKTRRLSGARSGNVGSDSSSNISKRSSWPVDSKEGNAWSWGNAAMDSDLRFTRPLNDGK